MTDYAGCFLHPLGACTFFRVFEWAYHVHLLALRIYIYVGAQGQIGTWPADASSTGGSSKSFFDLRQRTLSGMDLMPAFRVVVLGLARKLKNNAKDICHILPSSDN